MQNFGAIAEQIEKHKSQVTEQLEELTNEVIQSSKESKETLKKNLTRDANMLINDMLTLDKNLAKHLKESRQSTAKSLKTYQVDIKSIKRLLIAILAVFSLILVALLFKEYKLTTKLISWQVPTQYQVENKDKTKFIVIPREEIQTTEDSVYVQIKEN